MADPQLRQAPIRIVVDGHELTAWTSIDVGRSVLAAAGGVDLELPAQRQRFFEPGSTLKVWWGDQPLLDGYVDSVERGLGASVKVQGRDKAGDLVDASPDPNGRSSWSNQQVPEIAHDIATPFNVPVIISEDAIRDQFHGDVEAFRRSLRTFTRFVVETGETAWSAIERAARASGVLVFSPGNGTLRITLPDATVAEGDILQGINVIGATYRDARDGRHSVYVVRGQTAGGEETGALVGTEPEGSAADEAVGRFRPLVLLSELQVTGAAAAERAQWEASVRAARGRTLTVDLPSWDVLASFDARTPLWRVNQLRRVDLPALGVVGQLLTESIRYRSSKGEGTTASLTLVRRDAFIPDPTLPAEGEEAFDQDDEEGGE